MENGDKLDLLGEKKGFLISGVTLWHVSLRGFHFQLVFGEKKEQTWSHLKPGQFWPEVRLKLALITCTLTNENSTKLKQTDTNGIQRYAQSRIIASTHAHTHTHTSAVQKGGKGGIGAKAKTEYRQLCCQIQPSPLKWGGLRLTDADIKDTPQHISKPKSHGFTRQVDFMMTFIVKGDAGFRQMPF